jgi:Tol biopolymer transport system component
LTLSAGTKLGPYEILSPLGAGGMGEVYRAKDSRLKRDVAVKVLPASMSSDAERLRRFESEAEAASALNHPNILSIFDIGTEDGAPYIVSELLEGETLRAKLAGGPFQPRRAIGHALQIAHGLAAAHEKGIAHRDLKPENIFVTADGRVKILDFGLAKLTQPEGASASQTNLPTATEPGVVLGTLGYMAPEQVRGKGADARSDIFAFGAILYEMLSGRRAFQADTAADTISAILNKEPAELSETNKRIPESLDRIVRHCLEKSPESRFHSASDIAFDLEAISGTSLAAPITSARVSWSGRVRRLLPWLVLPALAAAFLLGRQMSGSRRATGAGGGDPIIADVKKLTIQPGVEAFPSLSPDGSQVVYEAGPSGNADIFLQRVGGHNPIDLTKDCSKDDLQPTFSPSGERIAFRSDCGGGGIFLMGATGENIRRLTDFGYYPAWSPDEKEIAVVTEPFAEPYSRTGLSELWAIRVSDGQKRPIRGVDSMQPSWSPHGGRIAYWGLRGNTGQRDIYTVGAAGEKAAPVVDVTHDAPLDWSPFWSADGRFLFFASDRGGSMNLWRVRIDERSGKTLSEPESSTLPAGWVGPLTASRDGRHVAYRALTMLPGIQRIPFDPVAGKVTGPGVDIFRSSLAMLPFEVSPDGAWIVFASGGSRQDLFLLRTNGTGLRQITDDAFRDRNVGWTRDGKQIVFMSDRSGTYETWSIHPDGSGLVQLTKNSGKSTWWPVFSPDGSAFAATDGANVFIRSFGPTGVSNPEQVPRLDGTDPMVIRDWSPDGKRLAGARGAGNLGHGIVVYSLDSRQYEVLNDSGNGPRFLPDSRRLLYVDGSSLWMIDSATKQTTLVLPAAGDSQLMHFALAPDGRSIYALQQLTDSDIWEATLTP